MGRVRALPHRALGNTWPPRAKLEGRTREGVGERERGCPGAGCPRSLAQLPQTPLRPLIVGAPACARRPGYRLPPGKLAALPAGPRRWGAGAAPLAD